VAIENIAAVSAAAPQTVAGIGATGAQSADSDFAAWLQSNLAEVNQQILQGDEKVRQLATGETSNLHEVMITLEKSKVSFELLLAVRNKVLEAYQELMRMQI
jgi:flagellar hook-basal body complex protein FliE